VGRAALPSGFLRGFTFRLLARGGDAEGGAPIPVLDSGRDGDDLELSEAPSRAPVPAGTVFEVRSPEEAPVLAARLVTGTVPGAPLPPLAMRLATTRGTNALLTRGGGPVALFVTRGFGDLMEIGTQQRPDLFALDIVKPEPFYAAVVEVPERVAADGTVLAPLHAEEIAEEARGLLVRGVTEAAVALMNSHRFPGHERELAAFLRGLGFRRVSCSTELAPFIKLLPRAETAVVNAYLAPVIDDYIGNVAAALPPDGTLHVMTSAGGLARPTSFRPKDSLLSGPAGGVAGAARAGKQAGFDRIIAFDMGGTSTDVARVDGGGDFEYVFEHAVGGARLVAPALAIETVAAGGGSVCACDRQGLRVGPESAGAHPGPACYGAGGPLTLTDVNLLLGRTRTGPVRDPDRRRGRGGARRGASRRR
jgi:5-oxoprolinase (ATP-hydrolysing)